MPAQVSSNPFTNDKVLFVDKAAANTWRFSMQVPNATIGTFGVVKQAANVVASNVVVVLEDETTTPLPLNDLTDSLIAAGVMAAAV